MKIWAIADLHLALSVPEKSMELIAPHWQDYVARIQSAWCAKISSEDLVLLPGDISWAMRFEEALIDLQWIDNLPGRKLMIRGNHDYWWPSLKKLRESLPPSITAIHNIAWNEGPLAIGGSRLWDFLPDQPEVMQIYSRELQRLELSLQQMDRKARLRIAMTHYPPTDAALQPTPVTELLEKYRIDHCVFGHLHDWPKEILFGRARNVIYDLVAADFVEFSPKLIAEIEDTP